MYLKKRTWIICAVALVLITSFLTVCSINPLGFFELQNFQKMLTNISVLEKTYYEEIDNSKMVDGILAGAAYSLGDPYTGYIPAEQAEEFMSDIDLDFTGIGVYISADTTDDSIVVISAIAGSPAEAAGFVAGDKILEIAGKAVTGAQVDDVPNMIKGEAGTPITLKVLKNGENTPVEITLNRDNVKIQTVTSEMLKNKIGFIRITQFTKNTYDEFVDQFNTLVDQGLSSLILDLRNNPGGRLDIAVNIADSFIDDGNIVYTMDKKGRKHEYNAVKGAVEVPMVILTNEGSASASEVVAGALRDHGKAVTLGEKTFGKGVVQSPMQYKDGSIMKVTISRYYTPNGECIDKIGIAPDIEKPMSLEKYRNLSNLKKEEDEQLQAAIKYLDNHAE
mgnify:CR=1 FL=1